MRICLLVAAGFTTFMAPEQFMHWHNENKLKQNAVQPIHPVSCGAGAGALAAADKIKMLVRSFR